MPEPLTLRYLGVAGWHFAALGNHLLIDPFFTRLPVWQVVLGRAIPDRQVIADHTPPADWVLVTHPHYDHLMDVPDIACLTGAAVYASSQGCDLLNVLGAPPAQCHTIEHGDRLTLGAFTVEVYQTPHRVIFGRVPCEGSLRPGLRAPLHTRDYRIQEQFSFRVGMDGLWVLIASGIDDEPAMEADVLLVGADAPREKLARIVSVACPRLVMPNHWDDMFCSLSLPVRPMIRPTRHMAVPRRIDLDEWRREVQRLAPGAKVVVPERFALYELRTLLM